MVRRRFLFAMCFASGLSISGVASAGSRLINGKPVEPGTYKDVVRIRSNGSGCTATLVGPRVIITAAHCAATGATATFTVNGTEYSARITRAPLYDQGKDHDVALGLLPSAVTGIDPATVGGKAATGVALTLLGYGCINPGGGGGNDGILRIGESVITGFSNYDMVSKKPGGAALCFGDSGGPAFVWESGKRLLVGINSKGNIQDTNYNANLDRSESKTFLQNWAQQNNVEICGVNKDCSGGSQPGAPTCTLAANPSTIELGQSITLRLSSTGQVTSAQINGTSVSFPTGNLTITPSAAGTFSAQGTVTGPGGSGQCSASYTVNGGQQPTAPTCTLAVSPSQITLGQSVVATLTSQGTVSQAFIDGDSVSFPVGHKTITPSTKGQHQVFGSVSGPGGNGTCRATFGVEDNTPQPIPNLTVVPAYCGLNTLIETNVREVCLSVLKKEARNGSQFVNEVLLITYSDMTKEVLPVIHRKRLDESSSQQRDELTLYANLAVKEGNYLLLDSRRATITSQRVSSGLVPSSLEGRTAKGKYFIVDHLASGTISVLPGPEAIN